MGQVVCFLVKKLNKSQYDSVTMTPDVKHFIFWLITPQPQEAGCLNKDCMETSVHLLLQRLTLEQLSYFLNDELLNR